MSKPKKSKKLPKPAEELTADEVMRAIFGKRAQEELKRQAHTGDDNDATAAPADA